ncbi:MAG TPA: 50S ribosomal protein L21 [Ktedonobacterales bacterium]|nr:50S ribosomal protein L21 [Ktedonobacterales bacterium]
MYAVIETGGKQYRVSPGQTVEVELLPDTLGATVALDRVLLVSADDKTLVGQPTVPGGKVIATIANMDRGKKIIVFKYKSKKRYRRTQGHRQDYSYLLVTDIQAEGESLVSEEERARYEKLARRAARRNEARLLAPIAALGELVTDLADAEAIGDEAAVAADEDAIEEAGSAASIPDEEIEDVADEVGKKPKKKKSK